MTPGKGPL